MNLILRDYLRRWWWVWVIVLPINLFFLWAYCAASQSHEKPIFFPAVLFAGSFLLLVDIQKGCTRALLSLPITVKELANIWRWEAVGLPFLASAGLNTGALLIYCVFKGTWNFFPAFALYNFMSLLMLGVMFFGLSGMPSAPQQGGSFREQLRRAFCGLLWGGSTGGGILLWKWLDPNSLTGGILMGIAAILTIWGWFRAELLVQERAGFRVAVQGGGQRKKESLYPTPTGDGGLFFLVQLLFTRMVLTGFGIITIFMLVIGFSLGRKLEQIATLSNQSSTSILIDNPMLFPLVPMISWLIVALIIPACLQVRFLRTLPFSASRLAAVLIFTPAAAMLTVFGGYTFLTVALLHLPISAVMVFKPLLPCVLLLTVPWVVWMGVGRSLFFIAFLLLIGVGVGNVLVSIFHWHFLPSFFSVMLPAFFVLAAFLLTKLALERSSRTYRPRPIVPYGGAMSWGGAR